MPKQKLKNVFSQIKNKRVAVIGDLMLDTYLWGKVTRISPEAPVPVVHVKKKTFCLGGAANVMRNIISLGAEVTAYGLIGTQENGRQLLNLIKECGISSENIIIDPQYQTIEKQRIIAESQQLARVDFEDKETVSDGIRERILNSVLRNIKNSSIDAIIFEDYAKGIINSELISTIIDEANRNNIVTALDPHPENKLKFNGLTLMTPNQMEAFALAGEFNTDISDNPLEDLKLKSVAEILNQRMGIDQLLITLGAKGMVLYKQSNKPVHIPTVAREVFDVTGAGDTVISTYTLGLLGGLDGHEAAVLANNAAGIVVGRIGTSFVTPKELIAIG